MTALLLRCLLLVQIGPALAELLTHEDENTGYKSSFHGLIPPGMVARNGVIRRIEHMDVPYEDHINTVNGGEETDYPSMNRLNSYMVKDILYQPEERYLKELDGGGPGGGYTGPSRRIIYNPPAPHYPPVQDYDPRLPSHQFHQKVAVNTLPHSIRYESNRRIQSPVLMGTMRNDYQGTPGFSSDYTPTISELHDASPHMTAMGGRSTNIQQAGHVYVRKNPYRDTTVDQPFTSEHNIVSSVSPVSRNGREMSPYFGQHKPYHEENIGPVSTHSPRVQYSSQKNVLFAPESYSKPMSGQKAHSPVNPQTVEPRGHQLAQPGLTKHQLYHLVADSLSAADQPRGGLIPALNSPENPHLPSNPLPQIQAPVQVSLQPTQVQHTAIPTPIPRYNNIPSHETNVDHQLFSNSQAVPSNYQSPKHNYGVAPWLTRGRASSGRTPIPRSVPSARVNVLPPGPGGAGASLVMKPGSLLGDGRTRRPVLRYSQQQQFYRPQTVRSRTRYINPRNGGEYM